MAPRTYPPATTPTLYFVGVSTSRSAIMNVFPRWAEALGVPGAAICGVDLPLGAAADEYRAIVAHIRADDQSRGALITTHKLDLLEACRNLFDAFDPHAQLTGEVSCISKRNGRLIGHAKDPVTSGRALDAFLPAEHWQQTGAQVLLLGAGGASTAMSVRLLQHAPHEDRPAKIIITDRSAARLKQIRDVHERLGAPVACEYHLVHGAKDNDRVLGDLTPHSLVVNATGLGKDRPGSPVTDEARFPKHGFAWDLNYRGDLVFLEQARVQQRARQLHVEDGWTYFVQGWLATIAEVFDLAVPYGGRRFDELAQLAASYRKGST